MVNPRLYFPSFLYPRVSFFPDPSYWSPPPPSPPEPPPRDNLCGVKGSSGGWRITRGAVHGRSVQSDPIRCDNARARGERGRGVTLSLLRPLFHARVTASRGQYSQAWSWPAHKTTRAARWHGASRPTYAIDGVRRLLPYANNYTKNTRFIVANEQSFIVIRTRILRCNLIVGNNCVFIE